MKQNKQKIFIIIISLAVCIVFGAILTAYARPMEDVSLDLSLSLEDGASPEDFDDKGWTVFTCEGETVKILESDGFGGYTGLELGQTFYFSRVLAENMDSPTLQLGAVNHISER